MSEPLRQSRTDTLQADCLLVKSSVYRLGRVGKTDKQFAEFGSRVLRARLEFGARQQPPRSVSQSEVGAALGVTGVAVGSWEAGKRQPDLGTIQKLALVLGVRAGWLAFGEEPMRLGGAAPSPDPHRNAGHG
jgi:DNA-binding XRE family transcriptional regulator